MLDAAVTGARLSREELAAIEPGLRVDLLNAQFDLQQEGRGALVVLLTGDDRVGCDAVFDRLCEWMDARHIDAAVFAGTPEDEEQDRPAFWRYWQALPARGRTGLFFGGWVSEPLIARLTGKLGKHGLERRIEHVRALERMLVADGTALLKLWMHLPKDEQARRLRKARRKPSKEWRVEDADFRLFEQLEETLRDQRRRFRRLGDIIVEKGWLERERLETASAEAAAAGRTLGQHLVALGWISEAQLAEALQHQEASDRRLGELLVEKDLLTRDKLDDVLRPPSG